MAVRVLLVEDAAGARDALQDLLASAERFELVAVAGGEGEAKIWLEDHPGAWDLAVVDLVLADGSGFGVLETARRVHAAGTIVVFSGYASPGVSSHCLALGATVVVDKAQPDALIRCLTDLFPP